MISAKRNRQRGMTLLELMLALTMLVVGLIGVLGLITTAISSNNRNKLDTGGTMLAQTVLEKIAAQPANSVTPIPFQDCNPVAPTVWQMQTAAGAAPGAGSGLNANGNIDWTTAYAAVPDGYKMAFVSCGARGQQATYEVRWNIQTVNAFSKMITVGARPAGMRTPSGTMLRFFARPVTLRTIVSTF